MFRTSLYLLLFVIAPVAIAQEPQLPSDVELRSAYCVPVLQHMLELSKQIDALNTKAEDDSSTPADLREQILSTREARRSEIVDLDSSLKRIQAYLLPRIAQRDPIAILAAQKRGETDWQQMINGTLSHCNGKCSAAHTGAEELACLNTCVNPDLVARLKACKSPTWLPF